MKPAKQERPSPFLNTAGVFAFALLYEPFFSQRNDQFFLTIEAKPLSAFLAADDFYLSIAAPDLNQPHFSRLGRRHAGKCKKRPRRRGTV